MDITMDLLPGETSWGAKVTTILQKKSKGTLLGIPGAFQIGVVIEIF